MVRFREDDILTDIVNRERDKRSMLTAFFETNKFNVSARQYLYKDIPKHFTWNKTTRCWNPRKRGSMRGIMVSANPAEGERFYPCLLLSHVCGPTNWKDLYTVNNVLYKTFRRSALERGLIENDDALSTCLGEGSLFQFPPALRSLFATILIFCEPGDVRKLWDDHYESFSEDYRRLYENVDVARNMVLKDIQVSLRSMSKDLDDFDLPKLNINVSLESGVVRELQEYSIVVEEEHLFASDSLNSDQRDAYDEILRHVDNDISGVFFIDGTGGTIKKFLYKALLANVRSCGLIALATTSSGAAANNMSGGRTANSRFKIPINLNKVGLQNCLELPN
ncbi:ATP-dependent DNA helicase PIF1-like protein [Tanacetum coccineum]